MLKNDQLETWDRECFFHPSTHLAQFARGEAPQRVVTGGEGVYIRDREGNRLLDAFAGLYCVNVGYGRQEIAKAIARQAEELAYYHAYVGHGTEASITLAKMVMERAPKGMSKVYFGLSGSDANETNIKLVWYYNNILGRPEKKKIISRWRGYHGSGLMTGSLTGLELFHKKFDLPLAQVVHTEAPYYYRRRDDAMGEEEFSAHCAAELDKLIQAEGPDTVAAFIGENNRLTGRVTGMNGQSCTVELDSGGKVEALAINIAGQGEKTTLSLRPERVLINPPADKYPNTFEAKVEELIYLGDHIRTRINFAGNDQFVVKVPNAQGHAIINEGGAVRVGWAMEDCRALDAS